MRPGHWVGVRVSGSANFNNVRIEYGGKYSLFNEQQSNLDLVSGGTVTLQNVALQHSLNFGFSIDQGNVLSADNVNVSFNGRAGRIDLSELNEINAGFWFSGNNSNVIVLEASTKVRESTTIRYLGAVYQVDRVISIDSGGVLIEPGVTMQFSQGVSIEVLTNAYFRAIGTFSSPILFSAVNSDLPWGGVNFTNSSSSLNSITHAKLVNAGSSDLQAAISMQCSAVRNGYLKLSDSTIRNSSGWGVSIGPDDCVLELAGEITYSGNDLGNLLIRE